MTNQEAIEVLAKILVLPANEPGYIIMAVKELWHEHCKRSLKENKKQTLCPVTLRACENIARIYAMTMHDRSRRVCNIQARKIFRLRERDYNKIADEFERLANEIDVEKENR